MSAAKKKGRRKLERIQLGNLCDIKDDATTYNKSMASIQQSRDENSKAAAEQSGKESNAIGMAVKREREMVEESSEEEIDRPERERGRGGGDPSMRSWPSDILPIRSSTANREGI